MQIMHDIGMKAMVELIHKLFTCRRNALQNQHFNFVIQYSVALTNIYCWVIFFQEGIIDAFVRI